MFNPYSVAAFLEAIAARPKSGCCATNSAAYVVEETASIGTVG